MREKVEEQLYSVSEVAKLLKVSPSTVWRWINAKRLPAYRVGLKGIRIRKEDLESILQPIGEGKIMNNRDTLKIEKLSPAEIAVQLAAIERCQSLREGILAARGGVLLPPSWEDIDRSRTERADL